MGDIVVNSRAVARFKLSRFDMIVQQKPALLIALPLAGNKNKQ